MMFREDINNIGAVHGVKACSQCPNGQYQNVDSTGCQTNCSQGQYFVQTSSGGMMTLQPSPTTAKCVLCVPGRYQDEDGFQTSCKACPSGMGQNDMGQTACKSCPAGREAVNGRCLLCSPGRYQEQSEQQSSDTTLCKSCPDGQYQNENGKTGCKSDCHTGSKIIDKTNCQISQPGQYMNSVGTIESCDYNIGQYQDSTNQSSCKTCPSGYYPNHVSMPTSCLYCESDKLYVDGIVGDVPQVCCVQNFELIPAHWELVSGRIEWRKDYHRFVPNFIYDNGACRESCDFLKFKFNEQCACNQSSQHCSDFKERYKTWCYCDVPESLTPIETKPETNNVYQIGANQIGANIINFGINDTTVLSHTNIIN